MQQDNTKIFFLITKKGQGTWYPKQNLPKSNSADRIFSANSLVSPILYTLEWKSDSK